jgi:hypothetical protein
LLGGPGDQVGTEEHRISRCGLAGFGATGPVSIRVDCLAPQYWIGAAVDPSEECHGRSEGFASEQPDGSPVEHACGGRPAERHR